MKTNNSYVASCVAPKKDTAVTGLLICGGLVAAIGGAGTVEVASVPVGIATAIVGVLLMYFGIRRIPRP